jgi:hypothetical protein
MLPRKMTSRRCSGRASTLISAAGDPSRNATSPTRMPDVIDVTRNSPITVAPATIRRSVSDETATPITP